ncbi:PH domain-containing protein [Alkalibacillus aidingensis]|uniref:PH domain-containing protein n=1 Tax=Alkalibacillus aidingensis TaxID=2747607 RepID=UPI0016607CED|nr:PH domain-containing protein [Alkalibacillus aidingensis]
MREPPRLKIAQDAIKAWKLSAALLMIIPWLMVVATFIAGKYLNLTIWFGVITIVLTIVLTYLSIFLIPKVRWRCWRYEVFDQEIYIQYGILVVSRTLVPMIRVQHVDTKQGPILKRYQLAGLTVSTAATTHEIPALPEEEAAKLRDQISELARVDEDDV